MRMIEARSALTELTKEIDRLEKASTDLAEKRTKVLSDIKDTLANLRGGQPSEPRQHVEESTEETLEYVTALIREYLGKHFHRIKGVKEVKFTKVNSNGIIMKTDVCVELAGIVDVPASMLAYKMTNMLNNNSQQKFIAKQNSGSIKIQMSKNFEI